MSKPSLNQIKKIFFSVIGIDHRDFASRYALSHGIRKAFDSKQLIPTNTIFGFESIHEEYSGMDDSILKLIEQIGPEEFWRKMKKDLQGLVSLGALTGKGAQSTMDGLSTRYVVNFCKKNDIQCFQLESLEVTKEIKEKKPNRDKLIEFEKRRIEEWAKNINSSVSSAPNEGLFIPLIVGGAHIPAVVSECLRFNNEKQTVKVVSSFMASESLVEDVGKPYGEVISNALKEIEDFTMKAIASHKSENHQQMIQAITDTRIIKTNIAGNLVDSTFSEAIVERAARFLHNTPSSTLSQGAQNQVVKEEKKSKDM